MVNKLTCGPHRGIVKNALTCCILIIIKISKRCSLTGANITNLVEKSRHRQKSLFYNQIPVDLYKIELTQITQACGDLAKTVIL